MCAAGYTLSTRSTRYAGKDITGTCFSDGEMGCTNQPQQPRRTLPAPARLGCSIRSVLIILVIPLRTPQVPVERVLKRRGIEKKTFANLCVPVERVLKRNLCALCVNALFDFRFFAPVKYPSSAPVKRVLRRRYCEERVLKRRY